MTDAKHFNGLSPAEAERLALLLEEMGEAQQAVGKILRHGYESHDPRMYTRDAPTNRVALEKELGDVLHAIDRMCESSDINKNKIDAATSRKAVSVRQWLHHQPDRVPMYRDETPEEQDEDGRR